MTKIILAKFAEFSRVRYLVDPAQPENGPIPLGVAIEAVIGDQWFVGISARSVLSPSEIEVLDGIGQELLQNPFEFVKREVHAVLPSVKKPGDVLTMLCGRTFWSANVAASEKWRGVRVLGSGSVEAQIKEQMSALSFRIVYETLKLPVPRPHPAKRQARAKPRLAHFTVAEPGRFFTQEDSWRVPLRLAHSAVQAG